MINDDTNAFGRLAIQFGRMARQKESDLVWAQITGNPVMGDGVTLFHASHDNVSGGAGAIAIDRPRTSTPSPAGSRSSPTRASTPSAQPSGTWRPPPHSWT
jgi:hypothetical protein